MNPPHALRLEGLSVAYAVGGREKRVIESLDLQIARGEAYGLVGESGCGKSTAAFAVVNYLGRNGRISGGRVLIGGVDMTAMSPEQLRRLRSRDVAMVYQDPGRALNPSLRIGRQLSEVFQATARLRIEDARRRALEMLARVQIAHPERVMASYPHELSGGLQQRVVIAMALSINPALLILDEPTTGLDATVEAEILDLVQTLRTEADTAILLISHSLPVISQVCDKVGVLYAGVLVEEGPAPAVFAEPRHPYTAGLLRCAPGDDRRKGDGPLETIAGLPPPPGDNYQGCIFAARCSIVQDVCRTQTPPWADLGGRFSRCHFPQATPVARRQAPTDASIGSLPPRSTPVLSLRALSKTYTVGGRSLHAVRDVSFDLGAGETLGLVGESGSGKSTLAKLLLGLVSPDPGGAILLDGETLSTDVRRRRRDQLKALQIVFQNPGLALNRAHRVRGLIDRALRLTGARRTGRADRVETLAQSVLLAPHHLEQRPGRLSGGLKQRVGIARAFACEPRIVVCDEPTAALDVSVQAAILNLFVDLQAERRVSYIFISHDLGVVNYLADRVAVLYVGRLLEIGPTAAVLVAPHHPYTEALTSASPSLGQRGAARIRLKGEMPSAAAPPSGCIFHTRCPRKLGVICEDEEPDLIDAGAGHAIRCHIPVEELRRLQSAILARDGDDSRGLA